jgi:hypothetical protein
MQMVFCPRTNGVDGSAADMTPFLLKFGEPQDSRAVTKVTWTSGALPEIRDEQEIPNAKLNIVFPEGKLPAIDPANPSFVLDLGRYAIRAQVNAKAARKLAAHQGGAVLQGKLVAQTDGLVLLEAGFTWLEPRAVPATNPGAPAPESNV